MKCKNPKCTKEVINKGWKINYYCNRACYMGSDARKAMNGNDMVFKTKRSGSQQSL